MITDVFGLIPTILFFTFQTPDCAVTRGKRKQDYIRTIHVKTNNIVKKRPEGNISKA